MHQTLFNMLILWSISDVSCVQIPWIDNVSLVPIRPAITTTILDSTCDECLCAALANQSAAVNCFLNNNTCQLFDDIPVRYRLQPGAQANVHFTSGSLPNASQCCMPDLSVLLAKLTNATTITVNLPVQRCLALDNHGYIVTIQSGGNVVSRFSPLNLTLVDQRTISQSSALSINFHGNAYYVGTEFNTIEVVDSNNLSTVNVIVDPNINNTRDMIFLHGGQIMVVASTGNQKLVFFNRSNSSSVNYTYSHSIPTSYLNPHGLWYVNDSFFYATSWGSNSVYSHATADGITWNEKLFANVNTVLSGAGAAHVMVDECGRKWISRVASAMIIYDSGGTHIGNFTLPSAGIFDAMFMDNYVLYVTDQSGGGKVVRLDPHITC